MAAAGGHMHAKVFTCAIVGLDGVLVEVKVVNTVHA
jgi:hypothetical protein